MTQSIEEIVARAIAPKVGDWDVAMLDSFGFTSQARDALTALREAGWTLFPPEPTPEMIAHVERDGFIAIDALACLTSWITAAKAGRLEDGMVTYGQTIVWNDFDGGGGSYRVDGLPTPEEARETAIRGAKVMGWTPPKWWQWWRWNDTRLDQPL